MPDVFMFFRHAKSEIDCRCLNINLSASRTLVMMPDDQNFKRHNVFF